MNFIEFLKQRMKDSLPGLEAQRMMAPVVGDDFFRTITPSQDALHSAVLILLVLSAKGKIEILLTLRNGNLDSHAGQISFPGGHTETGETPIETALREAKEETGIDSSKLYIIGTLSKLYVQPSNTIISPVVAWTNTKLKLEINKEEVEEAFFQRFDFFLDFHNIQKEYWNFGGTQVLVPFWDVGKKTPLWGATAMILSELIRLYQEFRDFCNNQ